MDAPSTAQSTRGSTRSLSPCRSKSESGHGSNGTVAGKAGSVTQPSHAERRAAAYARAAKLHRRAEQTETTAVEFFETQGASRAPRAIARSPRGSAAWLAMTRPAPCTPVTTGLRVVRPRSRDRVRRASGIVRVLACGCASGVHVRSWSRRGVAARDRGQEVMSGCGAAWETSRRSACRTPHA